MKLIHLVFALALALPVHAAYAGDMRLASRSGAAALTPFPMQIFCSQQPGECQAARNTTAKWSEELGQLLSNVNAQVNKDIRPKANPKGGWKINPRFGDCNDYALTKRSRLIQLGVPAGALRIAVTTTKNGVRHAILVVKTSAGEVVLDNLSTRIKPLSQTGYSIEMISTANPLRWAYS